jgi:DNA-binding NarL/FixJ family response regulator
MSTVTLGLTDDHKIVRDGIKMMLLSEPGLKIILEADSVMQLLEKLKERIPDILVLDLNLPGTGGLDAIEVLKSRCPEMKILILSSNFDEHSVMTAINKGVHGYLSKDAGSEEFVRAIRAIAEGDEFFGDTVSRIVYKSFLKSTRSDSFSAKSGQQSLSLSERELEVLKCFAEGMSYKQAADILCISPRTVETHRVNIMHKLGLENLADLVKFAIRHGIVSL